jgi:hypothetical protein
VAQNAQLDQSFRGCFRRAPTLGKLGCVRWGVNAVVDTAKLLIYQAKLDPGTAAMLCDVLDQVWTQVAPQFDGHPAKIQGPMTIANCIITFAEAGERDPSVLSREARSRVRDLLRPTNPKEPGRSGTA